MWRRFPFLPGWQGKKVFLRCVWKSFVRGFSHKHMHIQLIELLHIPQTLSLNCFYFHCKTGVRGEGIQELVKRLVGPKGHYSGKNKLFDKEIREIKKMVTALFYKNSCNFSIPKLSLREFRWMITLKDVTKNIYSWFSFLHNNYGHSNNFFCGHCLKIITWLAENCVQKIMICLFAVEKLLCCGDCSVLAQFLVFWSRKRLFHPLQTNSLGVVIAFSINSSPSFHWQPPGQVVTITISVI